MGFHVRHILFLALVLLCSCEGGIEEPPHKVTDYALTVPPFFPTALNIPADNPLTVEGVTLGRYLFYDFRLSGALTAEEGMSCASCHAPSAGFDLGSANPRLQDGRAIGRTGTPTAHNVLPLVNLIFNHEGYGWNGSFHPQNADATRRTIEDIVALTIVDPTEMNSSWEAAIAALKTHPEYPELFRKAFGTEEINKDRICKAIAQFVRTLISSNSKFDRYLRGEESLTPAELRGYILFTTEEGADCFHCHGGSGSPLFTTNQFYNNALDNNFAMNDDRYSVTGDRQDIGAYRAPTLRNIAVSAPYMHDGRFSTLDEVLQFYNQGLQNSPYVHPYMHKINEGGAWLTPAEIVDVKAFLQTLTDESFLHNEQFSNPHTH